MPADREPLPETREELFEHALREHGPSLRRMASGVERVLSMQEDLYQEICLALWRALPKFRQEASLRTFVFRVAHNRAVSHVLRQKRERTTHEPLNEEHELTLDPTDQPDVHVSREQQRQSLHASIRRLPLGLRQTVLLRLEGLSHRQIGDVLGISENATAIRLHRAQQQLSTRAATTANRSRSSSSAHNL